MSSFSQFVNKDDRPERDERDEKHDDVTTAANSLRMISGGGALQSSNNKQCASQLSNNKQSSKNNDNIGAIVAKSKKAAASLWTLLHAKVRSLQCRRRITASCAKHTLHLVTTELQARCKSMLTPRLCGGKANVPAHEDLFCWSWRVVSNPAQRL
jgi:hypothetical protein